jgi:hypothetical protein
MVEQGVSPLKIDSRKKINYQAFGVIGHYFCNNYRRNKCDTAKKPQGKALSTSKFKNKVSTASAKELFTLLNFREAVTFLRYPTFLEKHIVR